MKYAQVHQQLEFRLRRGPRELRAIRTRLQAELALLASRIEAARMTVAQAEADMAVMAKVERQGTRRSLGRKG